MAVDAKGMIIIGGLAFAFLILTQKSSGQHVGNDTISYDTTIGLVIDGTVLGTVFGPLTIDGVTYQYTDTAGIKAAVDAINAAHGPHTVTFTTIDGGSNTWTLNL